MLTSHQISTLQYWQAETKRGWQKNYLCTCGLSTYFGSEMLIMIRVRAHAYLLCMYLPCNEYQQTCILQANPKPKSWPLSITMVLKPSFLPCITTFMPEMHQFKAIPSQLSSAHLHLRANSIFSCFHLIDKTMILSHELNERIQKLFYCSSVHFQTS